ncbi:class I SAM-dependent methyltransferase [Cylindrospermopsis raciborskii CS-506_D]|uniref:Class I SAM-dependent methyltransferase n=1 Tax=Cylindrospermopsis raciborskii CS-506_A TaxID=2585140 RepID=A0A838WHR8_9CYAN|nr:class I SAM-dependent methyltransferase [Cylindrospermopsis raciborskii]MBA4445019.1 class I SAM-dependent methyltransferase [Cylindrospermopsis raciborskii CS-506_C]MBA4449239.1 class I SAM-dependent methyltransferase [Cylindrospermopsis raciborskii CS-506_D]MBA4455879.1 class I SAM-dependent methyltransferase [Cylindrospermopsis raciborskii CS-506_B]MBA4465221.1 class I SAM-dependent methyltransferase [Cylindrospermopsis raciborskii CS-506_A]
MKNTKFDLLKTIINEKSRALSYKSFYKMSFLLTSIKIFYIKKCTSINQTTLNIYTHTTEEERIELYYLSRGLSRGVVVEIGSYLGASTCFLAAGCSYKGGHVYAVDTWENQAMSEGLRDTYQEFLQNTADYKSNITPIRSFSVDAAQDFSQLVDLLFVDGDHSYEGVMADLKAWLPKLKPKAWLVLHDIGWAEGVNQAIREVVEPISCGKPTIFPNLYAVRVNAKTSF